MDIKNLATRTVSGVIYVALIVLAILWGQYGVLLLTTLFSLLAVVEFYKMTRHPESVDFAKSRPALILDVAGTFALCWGAWIYPLVIFPFILLARLALELYLKSEHPLKNVAESVFAMIYIGLPFGFMNFMASWYSAMPLLAMFFLIWINDTGAFLVGSTIGRHRLFERISPKKSWEGFFGGLAFVVLASVLFGLLCPGFFSLPWLHIWEWVILGVLVTAFSTWGDLFESLCKRNLHIKDSGNIIPGHGGILDRVDSLLFVAPVFVIFTLMIYILF